MNKHMESQALRFAKTQGAARLQDKVWVHAKTHAKQGKALLKHALSHHYDPNLVRAASKESPCKDHCEFTLQGIVDLIDFSEPCSGSFRYNTVYRQYPRFMKLTPFLDHVKYNTMFVGYHDPMKIMTHFAVTNSPWSPAFDDIITARFKGNFFEYDSVREFMEKPQSTRSGMLNRWSQNPAIAHLMQILHVWEVMSA